MQSSLHKFCSIEKFLIEILIKIKGVAGDGVPFSQISWLQDVPRHTHFSNAPKSNLFSVIVANCRESACV
jgi:hypothetical protein